MELENAVSCRCRSGWVAHAQIFFSSGGARLGLTSEASARLALDGGVGSPCGQVTTWDNFTGETDTALHPTVPIIRQKFAMTCPGREV
jgi:hypothetical protein